MMKTRLLIVESAAINEVFEAIWMADNKSD
jgi:hypothetical protein